MKISTWLIVQTIDGPESISHPPWQFNPDSDWHILVPIALSAWRRG